MSSAGGGGTEEVPFEATIDASALLQGLQQIAEGFKTLNDTVTTTGQAMNDAFIAVGDQINTLTEAMTTGFNDVETIIGTTNEKLDLLTSIALDSAVVIERMGGAFTTLNMHANDTVNWLDIISAQLDTMRTGMLNANMALDNIMLSTANLDATAATMSGTLNQVAANTRDITDGFMILDDDLGKIEQRIVTTNDTLDIMTRQLGAMSGQLTTVNDNLDIANTRLAAIGTTAIRMSTQLDEVNANLRALDGGISNISVNSDQMVTALQTIIDKLDTLNTSVTDLAPKFDELKTQIKTTGEEAKTAGEGGITDMMRSLGHVPATMLAWGVFNTASTWLSGFINNAIGGNATLERFRATLTSVTGSGSAADKLITWAQQFGQMIPDTTQNLEAATVKIASLGLNAQQVMPSLADVAAVMHVNLPIAARAFADAFHGRWMMMQNDLNVSKEQLQKYGLEIGKHGKVVESSLAPALAAYAKAKFPDGLAQAMTTYSGQVTNLTDKVQLLAMAFGKPVFMEFEHLMFQLIMYLTSHFDGIKAVVSVLGEDLAKAMGFVLQPLMNLLQYLPAHHALWQALAGLLGGTVVGVLVAISVMIWEVIGGVITAAAPFAALGLVIGIVVAAFRQAYEHSAPLRDALSQLEGAFHKLMAALAPLGGGLMASVKGALEGAFNALVKWLQSPQVIDFIHHLTQGIQWLTGELQKVTGHGQGFSGIIHDIEQHFHGLLSVLGPLLGLFLPLGGGIGAVVGLLAGGKAQAIKDIWGTISGVMGGLASGPLGLLKSIAMGALSAFASAPGLMGGFLGVLRAIGPLVPMMLLDFLKGLPGLIGGAVSALAGLGGGALATVLGLFRTLGGNISYAMTFIRLLWTNIGGLGGVFSLLRTGIAGIGPFLAQLGTWFNILVTNGVGLVEGAFTFLNTVIIPALTGGLSGLAGSFAGLIAPIMPFVGVALLIAGVLLAIGTAFHDLWTSSAGFRAMIAQVGKEFLSIGSVVMSSLMPVWHQLQDTLKTQLMPAWAALQHAFQEMRPVLMFIGGIIIALVLVALGLLIGVIKGVIAALGPLLSGVIMIFGGIAQFIAGVVEIISAIIGGLVRIIVDLATGNGGKVKADALQMWNDLKDGVVNVISGFAGVIKGLWTGIVTTILTLIGGFVQGVFDWFSHLFERLVGHSIITDGVALIVTVISDGLTRALLFVANFILGALQHFARIAEGIPIIGGFISSLLMNLANLVVQGVQFVINLKNGFINTLQQLPGEAMSIGGNIISSLGSALSGGLSHLKQIASNIGSNIMQGFKGMLGIASPSRVFAEYGKNIMEGLGEGLGQHDVTNQLATQIAKIRTTAAGQVVQTPITVSAATGALSGVSNGLGAGLGALPPANATRDYDATSARPPFGGDGLGQSNEIHIHMHIDGDATFGFRMLDPTTRAQLVRDIAEEMGKEVDMQTLRKTGYAGYH